MGVLQGWQITVVAASMAVALIIAAVILLAKRASSKRRDHRRLQSEEQWRRVERLHIMEGLIQAIDDPHRFLDIVLSAADSTAAEAALEDQFGLSQVQARAAMNLQFRTMSEETRQLIRNEADGLRG